MASTIQNPADVVNASLGRIGIKRDIGSLFDGSESSSAALRIYGQTRDELLRNFEWGFAERNIVLTLLKTAPVFGYSAATPWSTAYPPLPWIYEYTYPADMLKLRALRPGKVIPEYDPVAVEFRIVNDSGYTPARRVILTNLASAICVYTGQVTDPTTWDAGFTEAMIAALARRLAPELAGQQEAEKPKLQEEIMTTQTEQMKVG
jgi:hypothetical protein